LRNRVPTKALTKMTPYQAFYGSKPNVSHLCEIGCQVFVLILRKNNPKIYVRSEECVLIGYRSNSKTYRVYH
ncbi:copia protein, partial [Athelia psychrophila]